ncbi:MAG TPA: hypothetical protein VN541_13960 [Tepidisphaeraceae bacterium]|nr:hypothetical protein [Tepidisphaeraceae bacterium]
MNLEKYVVTSLAWLALLTGITAAQSNGVTTVASAQEPATHYFAIRVVDDQTGRGVPLVELQTTSDVSYYTDSNGLIAFDEPGLMNRKVFFSVDSPGYEYRADFLGIRGIALQTTPGGSATIKIKRLNIAERLYRVTGQGIYRDTVMLGRKAPIAEPLLNAQVTGQDSVLNAIYHGKLYWFYGDTGRISYALGNFSTTGATTGLPDKIDPSTGFNLHYFTAKDGFVRPMAPMKGEGVVWVGGIVVLPDESGHDRMLGFFQRRRGMGAVLENGFIIFNDEKEQFEKVNDLPINPPIVPTGTGLPLQVKDKDGNSYVYFDAPYPSLRVRADMKSYLDLGSYEGFTCLKPGTHFKSAATTELDRDAGGKLVWGWKRATSALQPRQQEELIAAGKMKRDESPQRLRDVETGKPVLINNCSCFWNDYRKKYVMIACQAMGATMLGEIWYSEADHPEGPWVNARKIITHVDKKNGPHDFYNVTQHPFFDREGGRVIYLEGTYVNTFSGNPRVTPYYEYNQIMYRLDLSDPRLRLNDTNTVQGK